MAQEHPDAVTELRGDKRRSMLPRTLHCCSSSLHVTFSHWAAMRMVPLPSGLCRWLQARPGGCRRPGSV